MSTSYLRTATVILFATLLFSSCSVIGGIFKTGVGVGVFLVVLALVIIGFIAMGAKK